MAEHIDLASWEPEYTANPYRYFARLRAEAPVVRVRIDGVSAWLVTRYDDIRGGLSDPRLSNDPALADAMTRAVPWVGAVPASAHHMARMDPPDHTRMRALVAKAFTPRRVEALRPRIQQIANELVAAIQPRGHADMIAEFALPLPLTVISELLGVPAEDHREFVRWTNVFFGVDEGDEALQPEARAWIDRYLMGLIAHKQRTLPALADAEHGTLLDGLIAARDAGHRLAEHELLAMSFMLVVAGYETTVHMISNGLVSLLQNPEQCAALRAHPERIRPALEELLRYEAPVKLTPLVRVTTTDVTIGGVAIPAGQPVLFALGAANRDPARFPNPDRLDLSHTERDHLSFGHGIHYCLGAPLARLEAEVAFTTLLAGCPDLALAVEPSALVWRHSRALRALKCLPVTFTPSAASAAR